jgi:hypothetical protein
MDQIKSVIQNQNEIIDGNQQSELRSKKGNKEQSNYYNWKLYAKEIQKKIKEIQEKYTQISKGILTVQPIEQRDGNEEPGPLTPSLPNTHSSSTSFPLSSQRQHPVPDL